MEWDVGISSIGVVEKWKNGKTGKEENNNHGDACDEVQSGIFHLKLKE